MGHSVYVTSRTQTGWKSKFPRCNSDIKTQEAIAAVGTEQWFVSVQCHSFSSSSLCFSKGRTASLRPPEWAAACWSFTPNQRGRGMKTWEQDRGQNTEKFSVWILDPRTDRKGTTTLQVPSDKALKHLHRSRGASDSSRLQLHVSDIKEGWREAVNPPSIN